MYEWDPAKSEANRRKHGFGFEIVESFDWETAITVPDQRFDYSEERYVAFGVTTSALACAIVFTFRGERVRIISARKMTKGERRIYERKRAEAHRGR